MSIDRHWQLAITPLSPIHLGTGQDYEPTGYVIDDQALYEFDGLAALNALPETERQQLGKILDGTPTPTMLRHVQAFFYKNRERLIAVSRRAVRITPSMEAFYEDRVGQVSQREIGGRDVQNRLEIERTAFNPVNGAPILPGSGLKGAIRTALLDRENDGRSLPPELRRDRSANLKLQQTLFKYRPGKFELDPMRLVRLADAAAADPDLLSTQVHFAVNRKKQPVMAGGRLVDSQAEQKGLYQLLECLPPLTPWAFRGQISIQDSANVQSRHWPDQRLRFDATDIAAACNRFYRPILERELMLLRERGFLDSAWADPVDQLLTGPLAASMEANRAFLLRVGRHSGAESVTLDGVRDIKIMKGKGERPEYLPYAKTLWLAAHDPGQQRDLLPFGWLLIEIDDGARSAPNWGLPDTTGDLADWRARTDARRRQMSAQLSQAQERDAEARRDRQAAEREAAEHAARLASLSPQAQKLEALREMLARDRAADQRDKGGDLANTLVGCLKDAEAQWQGADCIELADLATEIYGFMGWPAGKKKQQRKAQIEAIRNKAG